MHSKQSRMFMQLLCAWMMLTVCGVAASSNSDFSDLAALARADGQQYLGLRDQLREKRPEPWDVDAAANQSWELGLAAFILNQRFQHQSDFAKWDSQEPRLQATGSYYRLPGPAEPQVAFLLEKMWKKLGDEKEVQREYAYRTLQLMSVRGAGTTSLWTVIWRQATDNRLRYLAIGGICSSPHPSVQPIIQEILLHADADDTSLEFSKHRCLEELRYRDTEQSVDAMLDAWPLLSRNQAWLEKAIGALAYNGSDRARRVIHEFALNSANNERLRAEALAACCVRPQPKDTDAFRAFLRGEASSEAKQEFLRGISVHNVCPLEYVGAPLREVLAESDDPALVARAGLTLSTTYLQAKQIDEAQRGQDIALLEAVRARDDLSTTTRVHFGQYIEILRGNRPELPDRPISDR